MDPQILTALIAAASALIGAIVGASGTIVTARGQHKRTIEFERQKEQRARETEAAENCLVKIERMASLTVHERSYRDTADESWVQRANEFQGLREEVQALSLLLPLSARSRVKLALKALQDANDVVDYGFYYGSVDSVKRITVAHMTEVLTAVVRAEPSPPPLPRQMHYIAHALRMLDSHRNEVNAQDIHEYDELERRWLENNPDAVPVVEPDGWLVRLRRNAAEFIRPH